MTETEIATQEESKKDSPHQSSLPKTKSKVAKQTSDGSERPKTSDKAEKPPTKVVVRRLPPTMTLETFLDQVSPLPPVDYMYFVKADSSLAPNLFARAYLHFVHVTDLLIFTEKFDNYVFVDSKGNEYPAVVEFAPFQRIPKQRSTRKKDPRIGTIENDPYFQEFMEALKAEESQRKAASRSNKQHFFETSASQAVPKITSTPLLEFLKARRADKLKTKEDKIAERKKREIERKKAREDSRISSKQFKISEGDCDIPAPQIKIAGHGVSLDKSTKEPTETKRGSKETASKEMLFKRREEDRSKGRDRERRDRDRESKESHKDPKRESRKDSTKDQAQEKENKENQPSPADVKSKETRRAGKSYQEERQRLNERRQAAKGLGSKSSTAGEETEKLDRGNETAHEEDAGDKKPRKNSETTSESRSSQEKLRVSDVHRHQAGKDGRKFEKPIKSSKESDKKKIQDNRQNSDDRPIDDSRSSSEKTHADDRFSSHSQETRKKSYNQEREQRKAAASDRKNQVRTDCSQGNDSKQNVKHSGDSNDGKGHEPLEETLRDKSTAGSESSELKNKDSGESKADERNKKDPRAERRIRNKDRPSIEIYRPGMGRFSRQRLEREKGLGKGSSTERESPSSSPSPVPSSTKTAISEKET